jgi:hypothetical protein
MVLRQTMVSGNPLEMPQKKQRRTPSLSLTVRRYINVIYWQLRLYHFKDIDDSKAIAPLWSRMAHDHPSEFPLHWSTWEEE